MEQLTQKTRIIIVLKVLITATVLKFQVESFKHEVCYILHEEVRVSAFSHALDYLDKEESLCCGKEMMRNLLHGSQEPPSLTES
jgi:hypothetical protein